MNVTLTDAEYRRLMMLAYLGEWMVNAVQKDPDPAYEDTANMIYSFVKGTPLESLVTYDENGLVYIPTEAFEEEAHAIIDQYDDKTFWEELTGRLTERDLIAQHGERALGGMREDQKTRAASAIAKVYTKEFEEFGLDRLGFAD